MCDSHLNRRELVVGTGVALGAPALASGPEVAAGGATPPGTFHAERLGHMNP